MGDFGIKLSQEGHDVFSAADKDLIFSSAWRSLRYVTSKQVTPNASLFRAGNHELGYVPMVLSWTERGFDGTNQAQNSIFGYTGAYAQFNEHQIFFTSAADNTDRYFYTVFDLNLKENYQAPNITLETLEGIARRDKDFGIKLAKAGASIDAEDMIAYIMHSGTRSPMVHSVTYGRREGGITEQYPVKIKHKLGYQPAYFVFAKISTNPYELWQPIMNASDSFVQSNENELDLYISYECEYSIVILKDPVALRK